MELEDQDPSEDSSLELVRQQYSPVSDFSLAPTLEERGIAYFVTHYIVNAAGPTKGHLDYLTNICREDDAGEGLLCGMKAVGLAGFSHSAHVPSLMKNAQYQYWKALQATNEALKSPVLVKKDSTLTAIMILGIYETVTGSNKKSIHAWAEHVRGAAALLKLRGDGQMKTIRGRRMFVQVASSLMITCIQRDQPLPDYIIEGIKEVKTMIPQPEPAFLLQELMAKFIMFRAAIREGTISDLQEIRETALELDGALIDLFTTNLPPEWNYEIVHTNVKADVIWNGCYHIYYDYWISQLWNAMRTMRILAHEIIRGVYLKGFALKPPLFMGPQHTAQFQLSTDTLLEVQADIFATVPQHLGYVKSNNYNNDAHLTAGNSITDSTSTRFPWSDSPPLKSNEEHDVRMTGPYFLLWPLWLAGVMDVAQKESQDFVAKNLRTMAEKMGIRQANVLAQVLESNSRLNFE
jgi:hypothetical protein